MNARIEIGFSGVSALHRVWSVKIKGELPTPPSLVWVAMMKISLFAITLAWYSYEHQPSGPLAKAFLIAVLRPPC